MPLFGAFFYKWLGTTPSTKKSRYLDETQFHFSLKVPGKRAPSVFHQRGPYRERYSVSRAHGLFNYSIIDSYLSESPVKELSHKMWRKHAVTVHTTPRGRKAYIQWSAAWFPIGIVYDTVITTDHLVYYYPIQHGTFHLGPVSQRVSQ